MTRGSGFPAALGVLVAFLAIVVGPQWINAAVVGEQIAVQAGDRRTLDAKLPESDLTGAVASKVTVDLTPLAGWTFVPGESKDSVVAKRGDAKITVKAASGVRDTRVYFDRQARKASDRISLIGEYTTKSGLVGVHGVRLGESGGERFVVGTDGVAVVVDLTGPAEQTRQASAAVRELMDMLAVTR